MSIVACFDDEEGIRSVYKRALEMKGHMAYMYSNPEESLPEILEKRFDLIITDENMGLGHMHGSEFALKLRSYEIARVTPILIISNGCGEKWESHIKIYQALYEKGNFGSADKPFSISTLLDCAEHPEKVMTYRKHGAI